MVTDNLKAAVIKNNRYEPKLKDTFQTLQIIMTTTILPARVYKPRDKAIVGNAVRIMYTRVFAKLRKEVFNTKEVINDRILDLLDAHNNISFRGREYTRASLFKELEVQELKPLPTKRFELKQYAKGSVHKNSHICF